MITRAQSSEYSSSMSSSASSFIVQQKFSREENSKARGKIYGLLFSDPWAYLGTIPAVISGATPIFNYIILGYIINAMSEYSLGELDDPLPRIGRLLIYQAIVAVITGICRGLTSFMWIRAGAHVAIKIRDEIFTNIMKYDVAFFDTHPIGALLTILGEDAAVVQECFGGNKGVQFQQGGQFVIGTAMVFVYNWKLGLVALALFPVVAIIIVLFHPHIAKHGQARFRNVARSMTIAEETLGAIRTVRGYNREEEDERRFNEQTALGAHHDKIITILLTVMFTIILILMWAVVLGDLYWGATMVDTTPGAHFGAGQLFSCFGFTFFGSFGLVMLMNGLNAEQRAIHAGARIMQLLNYQTHINFEGGETYEPFVGHIKFENVSFCYPTRSVMALKNVTFEVKPGESVALVGHSGSGKSTCVQLIQRYYDVTEGIISIDGHNIKDLDPRWLHRKMALVSQDPILFQETVKMNVMYGVEKNKTDEEVWTALETANAKKFVLKFENQLSQMVGDRGSTLSGGQKQRIAIARAVIKDPTILICDEATSALDSESEKKVQAALDKILETRTGIIVAHRLSTIRNADVIYCFDAGEIKERGTHEELVAKQGLYYNLVKRQMQKQEAEEQKKLEDEKKDQEPEPAEEPKPAEQPKPVEEKPEKEEYSYSSKSKKSDSDFDSGSGATV